MELDLRYKQYNINNQGAFEKNDKTGDEVKINKPHQALIDFFETNLSTFSYKDMQKIESITDDIDIVLSNGATVKIGPLGENNIITRFGVKYPDGTGFIGYYCSTNDGKVLENYI